MLQNSILCRRLIVTAFFTFLLLISHASHSMEQTGIDVVLLMDSSGSMKKTDPLSLRIPAARMFISLLDKNDRAAVVSFSDQGYPLIHLTSPDGSQNKDRLNSAVNKVSSKGAHTNLYDALIKGKELVTETEPERQKIVILMTDGMMDTGNKVEDERLASLISDLLIKEFEEHKIKVYTIAFTEQSDAKLLQGIAVTTGGVYNMTLSDKELHHVFADIFESTKKPEMLPIDENGLLVDKSIEELTIVASRSRPEATVTIELPDGRKISSKEKVADMSWFSSPAFEMVTVQRPAEGRWKIHFSAGSDKAYIVSNMKLMTDFDVQQVPQGKEAGVKAWFEQDGSIITKKEILETTELILELTQPSGEHVKTLFSGTEVHGDTTKEDGVLSAHFTTKAPGRYLLQIVAKGKTFERERAFKFDVTAPTPAEEHPQPVKKEEVHEEVAPREESATDEVSWMNVILKLIFINSLIALVVYGIFNRDKVKNLIKRK